MANDLMDGVLPITLNFLQSLARISWQASVLILLLFLCQRVFRARMTAAWCYALWLLVLLRLALPFSVESGVSVFNWLPVTAPSLITQPPRPAVSVTVTTPTLQTVAGNSPQATSPPTPRTDTPRPEISPAQGKLILEEPEAEDGARTDAMVARARKGHWIAGLWLTGVLILGTRVAMESVRLSRTVVPRRLVTDSGALELLEDCKQLMGVHVPVVLVQTDRVSSPVLYGFLRPRVLLPAGLLQNFSREELRFVFLHELAHIRRHDIALSWLMAILQVLHWFNPLVWFAFARMKADRELACDALALSCTGEGERKAYGRTMLRLLEGFIPPARFPALAGILEEPTQMAMRIRCIAAFSRRTPSPAWVLGVVAVLALATLTDERVQASTSSSATRLARLVTTRPEGDTDIRFVTLRAQPGVDLEKAMARGSLRLAADADGTNLLNQGFKWIGSVDGLAADHWQRFSRANAPSPRTAHSVVWTGRELIVWGGGAQDVFRQTGGRYDPATDTWRPVSTNGAPAGRWHHAAQWTGNEMIVWGGRASFFSNENFNDGGRYDPETDSWKPMSSQGAPAPRSQMASAWTGREFIVWGGRGNRSNVLYDNPFQDGARYDPVTDRWTPMTACLGLAGRYDAAFVWTGREMILWGGGFRDQPHVLTYGDGARYNPTSDLWTPLPTNGAPRARYKHTAVWTGTEMIVWAGVMVSGELKNPVYEYFNDGARFNPATDRWMPISSRSAPGPRSSHLAVWNGSEMVVWGGVTDKSECLNSGGRYDPGLDRWASLNLAAVPAPRFMMRSDAGIWTGSQLLVFGGYDLNTEFGIGHGWSPPPSVRLYQRAR